MLSLYGRETSINVQKVAWTLGEMGLRFDWIDREGQIGNVGVEDYEKLNPARRVPTLVDNGLILNQSNSIVRYLASAYPGNLWLKDPGERAQADRWDGMAVHGSLGGYDPNVLGIDSYAGRREKSAND